MTFNLHIQMLRNWIFLKIHRYETGGNSVHWMFTTFRMFFFQIVIVLPARYVHMCNFLENSKQMQAIYIAS